MNVDPNLLTASTTTHTKTIASSSSPSSSTFSPSSSSATSLFPPLPNDANPFSAQHVNRVADHGNNDQEQEGIFLWNNVSTFAIPGDEEENDEMTIDSFSPSVSSLHYSLTPNMNTLSSDVGTTSILSQSAPASSEYGQTVRTEESKTTAVFNISWGGNDVPPRQLHPTAEETMTEETEEENKNDLSLLRLSRPLPKPRGIRKLPEPEPSADGTIDEDVLKRRKNTEAARKSRLKKLLKVEQLENKVNSLQAENAKLVLNNAILESEKRSMKAKEADYQKRIKYLEGIVKSHGLWDG
ncbi:hypothetical protein BDF20DRAFT_831957 [Mycotypha africana]|uniref:uncharacterized protein n=1 Tax=Mycotypha africana TaxID=64632 RepID=UPI002300491A|nr:uncharacterized protein BDF20DRAFT_831957 [Mycotypha africana]KAI8991960.1 hypothetical protein BDF20DRAFT_831957 [Mycotypha africana]